MSTGVGMACARVACLTEEGISRSRTRVLESAVTIIAKSTANPMPMVTIERCKSSGWGRLLLSFAKSVSKILRFGGMGVIFVSSC